MAQTTVELPLAPSRTSRRRLKPNRLAPYLLVAPAFIVLGVILIYPALYNIALSFWEWRFTNPAEREFIFF